MTQEERWIARYKEVVNFIEANHRNPSKYAPDEKIDGTFSETWTEVDECWGIEGTETYYVQGTDGVE